MVTTTWLSANNIVTGAGKSAEQDDEQLSADRPELVIITGLSGSGKGTVLRVMEDLGYFAVDNLPIELLPTFAELIKAPSSSRRAALVIDIREGESLNQFPAVFEGVRHKVHTRLLFMEAVDATLVRRFSETRRPHPLGRDRSVPKNIEAERELLQPIRKLADLIVDTSKFNVHELRDFMLDKFQTAKGKSGGIRIGIVSFGFRHGLPPEADLVFDVRFLPNPNYIPEYKHLTGKHPKVAKYIRGFKQTQEFIARISDLLVYLLPHYIEEGKSYLTIAFGCTGGQHRSVLIAAEVRKRLAKAGFSVKEQHRDAPR